jgi:enoyl-CoA hydratase/carnithine racemase
MISIERHDKVAVITLNRSVTNPINLEMVTELAKTFQEFKQDSDVRGLVLTSSNQKFFSIGFDIPQLFELDRSEFEVFYRAYNRLCLDLYTLPKPTIAALPGHAIAGGCILALCCDYRHAAEGRKLMGLNEVKLGVPVPYPTDCILRQLVGVGVAREVMEEGEFYTVDEAQKMGMVDRVLPVEHVLRESVDKADTLGQLPENALTMIKRNRVELVEAQILARLEDKEQYFIECWYSEGTRERLRKAMEKF